MQDGSGSSQVIVVMAVFRPDPEHLRAQMASIAGQSHTDLSLIAVIADTVSETLVTGLAAELELECEALPCDFELDPVRAFEAGLVQAQVRVEAARAAGRPLPMVALSDQDDLWHPDRIARGVAALDSSGAALVHSDARLVAGDGATVLAPSMFAFERRARKPGLRGLLYRNNITGMTALMRGDLLRLALPFPAQSGVHFYHDLWLGLVAAATDGVFLIDAALVDYRQHGANAIGAVDREAGWLRRPGQGRRRLPDAMWLRREAASYGLARYLGQSLHHRLTEAVQDGRLSQGAARVAPLRPYLRRSRGAGAHLWDAARLAVTGKPGLARIAAGFGIVSLGRVVWTLRQALGAGLAESIEAFDTRLYSLSPGVAPKLPEDRRRPKKPEDWQGLVDIRKTPRWAPDFSADTPALVVLVPTLNPTEIFAGIVTALDIGLGLAARGHQVRFVATDLPVSSPGASRAFLMGRLGGAAAASGAGARVSLHCGVQNATLPAHPGDRFLATAWWSAHVAQHLTGAHGYAATRFFYLIQDFEPGFYPWGPEYAGAMESYGFDFEPIFNTTLLRDHFAAQGMDFATPEAMAFRPSIDVDRYAQPARAPRDGRPLRLALYGRPEVPRNMYSTAIEALAQFLETARIAPTEIELVSIGLAHAPVTLPGGHRLESLGKLPWEEYPGYLRAVDLGLSLMYSPHPSHPPIEMAASGVRVVTNGFGPKDLGRLSPAITSTAPTATALAAALAAAWEAARTGPVPQADRQIDLGPLGCDIATLCDRLSDRLARPLPDARPRAHQDAAQ